MGKPVLHQFVTGASPGDAITDQALLMRRWIREDGFRSDIFAESIHPGLTDEVRPYLSYRPKNPGEPVILHHSIGSDMVEHVLSCDVELVLIYHNVTPPEFVQSVDPTLARQLERGREQLGALRSRTMLALGVSGYDEAELERLGYRKTGVLPIVLDDSCYEMPPNQELLSRYRDGNSNLLFVGRLVPNKRQGDLIKLLYHFRRIEPSARLFLVGSPWLPSYAAWLRELADELEVGDAVVFTGYVSQQDLVTYYQLADVYVSMSEHEGLGKPLLESMYFGVPIMAYAAAAVPETLGASGVLFHYKNYEALAELVSILVHRPELQHWLLAQQRRRMRNFLEPQVRSRWQGVLEKILKDQCPPH